jgi:hypothetical protein
MTRDAGATMVELLVASGIMLTASAAVFTLVANATATSPRWNEAADLHQRARMALDVVYRTLAPAGAGLTGALPAIEPRRRFTLSASPSAITVRSAPEHGARSTLTADLAPGATVATIAVHAGCASGLIACGFTAGSEAAVFEGTGSWHLLALESTAPSALGVADRIPGRTTTFAAGATLVEILETSLYFDRVSGTLRQEGPGAGDFPVLDNIVDVRFEYFGEGLAPMALQTLVDGPLCGSGSLAYDCDLARIRSVRVRIGIAHARPDVPGLTAIADISPRILQR